jgi:hypothetical protein
LFTKAALFVKVSRRKYDMAPCHSEMLSQKREAMLHFEEVA